MKTLLKATLLVSLISGPSLVWGQEQGSIELASIVETERAYVSDEGTKVLKRTPAERVTPGDELIYTIKYRNVGQKPVENLVITNPIPEHTLYRPNSAVGKSELVAYSVDGGETYQAAEDLVITDEYGNVRSANFKDYTHIKWTLQETLSPEQNGEVGFRAVLE